MKTKYKDLIEKTPKLYNVWRNIKYRCNTESCKMYKNYGGRGIKICDEWRNDFKKFYHWAINNGYKEGLSIDRIDVDGNYEPNNCRWTTSKEQNNNKRKKYIYKGESKTILELAKEYNIPQTTLYKRIARGLSLEEAIAIGRFRSKYNTTKYVYQGEEYSLKELAEKLQISYRTLHSRITKKREKRDRKVEYIDL